MKAPCPRNVKMPSVEPFDGAIDLSDRPDVYRAQMYVQDVDNATAAVTFRPH